MLDAVYTDTKDRMDKTLASLDKDLQRIRTGRASANLLDGVKVDYYGTPTQLAQMATIAVPESRLLTIQPWDVSVIKDIEKAILGANLGLTPSNDGKIIRLSIPPLTEDRRKELVKSVSKACEDYKVALRNIRRDANEDIKALKKDGDISEDDAFKAQEEIQKSTDAYIKKIDEAYKTKEHEILEF